MSQSLTLWRNEIMQFVSFGRYKILHRKFDTRIEVDILSSRPLSIPERRQQQISFDAGENLPPLIRNHQELISDKWASIERKQKRITCNCEYKWCYKCFGKSINLQWIEEIDENNKQEAKLKMNLVNKFVINDFPKRLLIAQTERAYRISFKDVCFFSSSHINETTAEAIWNHFG